MKKDKLRNLGEATAAAICIALCGIVLIYVSFPLFDWLFAVMKPEDGFDSDFYGFLTILVSIIVSMAPTIIAYDFLNTWFIGLRDNHNDDAE